MSLFFSAIEKIAYFARKADVKGQPRLSITFDNNQDKAYFEAELKREWPVTMKTGQKTHLNEFDYCGIKIRLL